MLYRTNNAAHRKFSAGSSAAVMAEIRGVARVLRVLAICGIFDSKGVAKDLDIFLYHMYRFPYGSRC
jgi:hypothetical protein